ncbi:MAG: glutathione S-transferase [Caulobacteraceae bacterium]|nr:glutathione S-transferase [Caulobacteraceae bacterium]
MSLVLHGHPLSSYCHKALTALYELDAPFELAFLNLGDAQARDAFYALWPVGKMPVLEDKAAGVTLPEASIIIEYLNDRFGGSLIPKDKDKALEVRLQDRFFDLHVHQHMQVFAAVLLRPPGQGDPYGVAEAAAKLEVAYDMIDRRMADREWAAGDAFSMADCAAAPALFYAEGRVPFGQRPNLIAYLQRLKGRPSYARALKEAEPYFHLVPR